MICTVRSWCRLALVECSCRNIIEQTFLFLMRHVCCLGKDCIMEWPMHEIIQGQIQIAVLRGFICGQSNSEIRARRFSFP